LAGLVIVLLSLTACGDGWWTPLPQKSAESSAPADLVVAPSEPVDIGPVPTLDVTVSEVPKRWNEMAAEVGIADMLPDPLVADDTTDGVSSLTVPVGDGTIFIQWQSDDGKVLIFQLDIPVPGDPTTSTAVPVLEAVVHSALGLTTSESSRLVDSALADALANSIDPVLIDWSVTTDAGDLLIAIIDEMGSFTIIPAFE
jgi:hypothetical protein